MKRRQFLNTVAATSAAAISGVAVSGAQETEKKYTCKITVLKCTVQTDFIDYSRTGEIVPCQVFKEGQEFVVESPWSKPEGFCDWAWADFRTMIHNVYSGHFEKTVTCCTDGYRPVFFYLERVEI